VNASKEVISAYTAICVNPNLHGDLCKFVAEVAGKKRSLLLINPADTSFMSRKKLCLKTCAVSNTFISSRIVRTVVCVFCDESSVFILLLNK